MKKHSVRVYAGDGSMIAGLLENEEGKPLSRREAMRIARIENERSDRRRKLGLPGAFQYAAFQWEAE